MIISSGIPAVSAGALTSFTTTFPATENPISQGGTWFNGLTDGLDWNDIQTSGNKAYAAAFDSFAGGVSDGTAQLKTSVIACTSNQYSAGTVFFAYVGGETGTHEAEVFINMTITAHSITGYECYLSKDGNHTLVRWNGLHNDFTALASGNISTFTAPVDGDVIRVERTGSLISCFQNGILRTTANDSNFLGGNPGIGNNPTTGGIGIALNKYGWKSWTCGNN